MKKIGAHISAGGGVENAPLNAKEIGGDAFAFFTKNQRQWKSSPLSEKSIKLFKESCKKLNFDPNFILPHDTYLINMGSPDSEIRRKSEEAFLDELKRCEQLGLKMLNFHPGSHRGEMSEEECLDLIAESVNRCLKKTKDVVAVIENTAGQGGSVGKNFEQIKYLIEKVDDVGTGAVKIQEVTEQIQELAQLKGNLDKLNATINWQAERSLKQMVEDQWRYYQASLNGM